jgi:YegS/Rv2252/BmrU family lipid kinase
MYQIIFNPTAGKKKAVKGLQTVCETLKARGVAFQVHQTACVGDAEKIARRLTRAGASNLIVLGGDGTLHEVLNGLENPARCKLGLVPLGTGNDFAEAMGLPMDTKEAVKIILNGEAQPVDYLQISDRRCMNVAGFGMDVEVLEGCQRGKLKGKLKYLMSLLHCVFTYKGCALTVENEGEMRECNALIAAACNGTQFGGGIRICPDAKINDGKINVLTVDCIGNVFKLMKALVVLLRGKILQYPKTTHFLCDKIRFIPKKPCTVQLDGELYKNLEMEISIGRGLRMYR